MWRSTLVPHQDSNHTSGRRQLQERFPGFKKVHPISFFLGQQPTHYSSSLVRAGLTTFSLSGGNPFFSKQIMENIEFIALDDRQSVIRGLCDQVSKNMDENSLSASLSRLLTINHLILLRHLILLDNQTNHFRLHNRDRDSLVSMILSLVVEIRERDPSRRSKGRKSRKAALFLRCYIKHHR